MILIIFFEKDYYVGPGETDLYNLCRPSALLLFLQDAATAHSAVIGMGREMLIERCRAVWILSRLRYTLNKPIRNGDTVHIKTWHRGLEGIIWYRDFSLYVNGEEIGQAVHAWVLADIDTHRLKRPTCLAGIDADSATRLPGRDAALGKLHIPDDISAAFEKRIHYSDLDMNSHLNNTKYADLCCDAMHFENMDGKYISDLQINYTKECLVNDRVLLCCSRIDNSCFISGISPDNDKTVFFEAAVSLADTFA